MKKIIRTLLTTSLLFGLTGWSKTMEIAPKSSVFYGIKQQLTDENQCKTDAI